MVGFYSMCLFARVMELESMATCHDGLYGHNQHLPPSLSTVLYFLFQYRHIAHLQQNGMVAIVLSQCCVLLRCSYGKRVKAIGKETQDTLAKGMEVLP